MNEPAANPHAIYDTVLFDLDGTLSDSSPGILRCLEAAFADLGLPWLDEPTARSLLGPPFWHTLPPLVGKDRVEEAVAAYRRHYVDDGGMFETSVYDGIAEVLKALSDKGIRLAVATSKPEQHATEILGHLGLAGHFETIGGDTLDGQRDSKALVIGAVLDRLGNPDPGTVLMVGDRSQDVLGAAAHGIACAGALWGYGSVEELTEAGAAWLCQRAADLVDQILYPRIATTN
ncbi:MAG TPA: HAD hydrolase-like protein [Jatrophihabitans sp.]|jgi:phosphoglycolate phosphatase